MKLFKTNASTKKPNGEIDLHELATTDLTHLGVTIGNTIYILSESKGQLRVCVEGQLVVMPSGADAVVIGTEILKEIKR